VRPPQGGLPAIFLSVIFLSPICPAAGGPAATAIGKRSIPDPVLSASYPGPVAVLIESYPDPIRLLIVFCPRPVLIDTLNTCHFPEENTDFGSRMKTNKYFPAVHPRRRPPHGAALRIQPLTHDKTPRFPMHCRAKAKHQSYPA